MSTGLSFRERAAIAAFTAIPKEGFPVCTDGAALAAQDLANACCKAWGHVDPEARQMPAHLAAMMGPMVDECPRCGKVVPTTEEP